MYQRQKKEKGLESSLLSYRMKGTFDGAAPKAYFWIRSLGSPLPRPSEESVLEQVSRTVFWQRWNEAIYVKHSQGLPKSAQRKHKIPVRLKNGEQSMPLNHHVIPSTCLFDWCIKSYRKCLATLCSSSALTHACVCVFRNLLFVLLL